MVAQGTLSLPIQRRAFDLHSEECTLSAVDLPFEEYIIPGFVVKNTFLDIDEPRSPQKHCSRSCMARFTLGHQTFSVPEEDNDVCSGLQLEEPPLIRASNLPTHPTQQGASQVDEYPQLVVRTFPKSDNSNDPSDSDSHDVSTSAGDSTPDPLEWGMLNESIATSSWADLSEEFQVTVENTFVDVKEVLPGNQQAQNPSPFFPESEGAPLDDNVYACRAIPCQQLQEPVPMPMQSYECLPAGTFGFVAYMVQPELVTCEFVTHMAQAAMKFEHPTIPDAEFTHAVESLGPAIEGLPWPSLGSCLHGLQANSGRALCKPCAWFHKGGCSHGKKCFYCHTCSAGELAVRRKLCKSSCKSKCNK